MSSLRCKYVIGYTMPFTIRGAVEYSRSKAVRCRTVLCGGIRITDGRHVFPGDLHISVTTARNRRLDDRRLHPIICCLADDDATTVRSAMIMSDVYLA